MATLGTHILADFYDCRRLDEVPFLRDLFIGAVVESGADILHTHFQEFSPHGLTGVIVVAESHLAFHTWPEHLYLSLDYFTCGDAVKPEIAISIVEQGLNPGRVSRTVLTRGTEINGC